MISLTFTTLLLLINSAFTLEKLAAVVVDMVFPSMVMLSPAITVSWYPTILEELMLLKLP